MASCPELDTDNLHVCCSAGVIKEVSWCICVLNCIYGYVEHPTTNPTATSTSSSSETGEEPASI
jgi:hypothetical protein